MLEGRQSRWFLAKTGAWFSIVTAVIYHICNGHDEAARRKGFGSDNGWNSLCGSLMYADDIVLLVEKDAELQKMLDVVGHCTQEWRFRFNTRKSKTMLVGANSEESWTISEVPAPTFLVLPPSGH